MFKKHTKDTIRLFLTGFSMGSADIVPGVSGGTIAFISGIYEELIYSIRVLSSDVPRLLLKGNIKKAISQAPIRFLLPLGFGILAALILLSRLISHLLESQPVFMWSFFFGLVIASIYVVRKRVITWDPVDIFILIFSSIFAYFFVGLIPASTPNTLPFFFFSGFIAIVAMILPGISGSFLLVILGKYDQILNAVVEREVLTLVVVAIGAIAGLFVFSRILTWLFNKHHDIIIASLTGFMVGSLRKIWPWKETVSVSKGEEIFFKEFNTLPQNIDVNFFIAVFLALLAASFIIYLNRLHVIKETTADIEDKKFKEDYKKAIDLQKHNKN